MTAIKVTFEGETRRFPPQTLPLDSLEGVRAALSSEFPALPPTTYALRYTDEEGDVITIRSQSEWEEGLACLRSGNKIPRFTLVADGERKSAKTDEEQRALHDPLAFLADLLKAGDGEEKDENPIRDFLDAMRPLAESVEKKMSEGQEGGAKGNRCPPPPSFAFGGFPMPFFGAFNPPRPTGTEEGPSGPPQGPKGQRHGPWHHPRGHRGPFWGRRQTHFRADRANFHAVEMMEAKDFEGAKALLEKTAVHCPGHASTRYNLGCTQALLGNPEAALASLTLALELGFNDYPLMHSDPDLQSLNGLPAFETLLESIRPKTPEAQPTAPVEEPLPEEPLPGFNRAPFLPPTESGPQDDEDVQGTFQTSSNPFIPEEFLMPDPKLEYAGGDSDVEFEESDVESDEEEEEEEEEPFLFAREFAEVREIGVPVADATLRSLLLTHNGDVGAAMAELCTTPRE